MYETIEEELQSFEDANALIFAVKKRESGLSSTTSAVSTLNKTIFFSTSFSSTQITSFLKRGDNSLSKIISNIV